ncbi:sugar phosphate isomerase/epimerase family protein [Maribacter sp. 2308TA10-17]|uniref:sugar phosphate isomerase/epimerase family protein n=1 Tax=Maribacter sp. 2308TA10-17 TaxID=3386276 RepID=UPI0039BC3FA5
MKKSIQRIFQITLILMVLSLNTVAAQDQMGGLALYTVRNDMGTNAKATLQAVADTGYKNIEAAGYKDGTYYGMSPKDFRTYVKQIGLKPISTHQSDVTLDNMSKMFVDAKAAGFKYFVVPIPPMGWFNYDGATATMSMTCTVEELAKTLNAMGEKARKAGLKLLYHNHDFEFKKDANGVVPIDYLLENCNPKYVNFQMDLFWVTKAGADPLAYFKKYPKRFKMWHVKDMDDQGRFAPVGRGTIDFTKILAQKKLSGMKYFMVEQDQTFDDMKPLDAIKISRQAIEKIGFK